jgi:deoxyadenosine/deoxycytidine kinase
LAKQNYLIAIAGNIGVGKTTLAERLSEKFGWEVHYESVINNPYLDNFYNDMKRWSFNLQIYFLSHRFRTLQSISNSQKSAVQDRTIYEDVEIFAKSLFEQGYMTERDYKTYRDLFYDMEPYIPGPNIIIYLKASTSTLLDRIRKRGRGFEKTISEAYIRYLNKSYEKWIKQAKKDHQILVINSDETDYVKGEKDLNELVQIIKKHCP